MFPAELKYTKSHEYVKNDGSIVTLGVSQFAVDQVKDIVYLELPNIGQELRAGMSFGTLESVKAVFDLLSPVSGKVIAVNDKINSAPDLVTKSPYGEGWLVKLELNNPAEIEKLLSAVDYGAYTKTEGVH